MTQQYLRRNIQTGADILLYQQRLERTPAVTGTLMIDGEASPDGTQLAVLHQTFGNQSLSIMPLTGGDPRLLHEASGQRFQPVYVAYFSASLVPSPRMCIASQRRFPRSRIYTYKAAQQLLI